MAFGPRLIAPCDLRAASFVAYSLFAWITPHPLLLPSSSSSQAAARPKMAPAASFFTLSANIIASSSPSCLKAKRVLLITATSKLSDPRAACGACVGLDFFDEDFGNQITVAFLLHATSFVHCVR